MAVEMTGYCKGCPYYSPEVHDREAVYIGLQNAIYSSIRPGCEHENICQRVFESVKLENVIQKTETIKQEINWSELEYRFKPFRRIQFAQTISILLLAVSMIIHIFFT